MAEGNTQLEEGMIVGARKRSDGTFDTSRAAHLIMTEQEKQTIQAQERAAEEKTKQAKEQRYKIPEDVEEGTVTHAWYQLRNDIYQIEDRSENQPIGEEAQQHIRNLRLQQDILEQVELQYQAEILNKNSSMTLQQAQVHVGHLSAPDALGILNRDIEQWKGMEPTDFAINRTSATGKITHVRASAVLEEAGKLQARLSIGAAKTVGQPQNPTP